MGYIYLPSTTSTSFRTALTTLTTLTPTTDGLVYKNGAYENRKVEAEKHYVISESELKALKIQVEESRLSFNGRTSVNFYPERKLKKIKSLDIQLGHVYFFKSAGSHKVGCSCVRNIKNRVRSQCPDEVIAVSEARKDYKDLEKRIHRMFAKNQVGKYEIFNDLTENDIQKIKRLLGNKIAVDIRLRKRT
tara:strand:+ start:1753 stop:2322 length:570 start_codon:yes stop_codon:yes gene_type:complete